MKLELVSHTLRPYVHRAAAMIHEKGVPFERRYIDRTASPTGSWPSLAAGQVPVRPSIARTVPDDHAALAVASLLERGSPFAAGGVSSRAR